MTIRSFSLLLLTLFLSTTLFAQSTDFEAYPKMDVDYRHLSLTLGVDENGSISGEAEYSLVTRREGIDFLVLNAVKIDVEQVLWDGMELDFRFEDDKLFVDLPDNVASGRNAKLLIIYSATPAFGVHRNETGILWTSQLPGSVRHWLPALDHPRNSLTTEVTVTYPSGNQVVFNGSQSESHIESVDRQQMRFVTDSPIPVTGLAFAVGNFEQTQTSVGRHQIYLHSQQGLLDSRIKTEILDSAYEAFRHAERKSNMEYPLRALHLVVLNDDRWETKHYGAGVVFAYDSKEKLVDQIQSGVTSQWFGVQLREEQWSDAQQILMLQAWMNEGLIEVHKQQHQVKAESVYDIFSMSNRDVWQQFLFESDAADILYVLDQTAPNLLTDLQGVVNWYDASSFLYDKSGQPFMTPLRPEIEPAEEKSDIAYSVDFTLDEAEGSVRLDFQALDSPVPELVSVRATEYSLAETRERDLAFTGASDAVVLNVDRTIENLKLEITDDSGVKLDQNKPFMFWIYQLRNDEDVLSRKDAAVNLRKFTDNPDIQLALIDLLENENHPEVNAEILRTLGEVTGGASGTQDLFMQRFRNDSHPAVLEAIAEAFGNYEGNDRVISELQRIILQTDEKPVKKIAATSLAKIAATDRFSGIVESLAGRETAYPVMPILLKSLANKGERELAVQIAGTFIGRSHTFERRTSMLELILQHDRSSENWNRRAERLISDPDPRIRYQVISGFEYMADPERSRLLQERLMEEYDVRVLDRLKEVSGM